MPTGADRLPDLPARRRFRPVKICFKFETGNPFKNFKCPLNEPFSLQNAYSLSFSSQSK